MTTIWIIDDDQAILSLLVAALDRDGVHVTRFQSVEEAASAAQRGMSPPDVCLADWTLRDGPALRIRPLLPGTRWVVMSGNPLAQERLPDDVAWLPKPFKLADLERVIGQRAP